MVIVLAAPKQKGILDVSIKYVGGLHKEREMFNGRYYYYYEMGEYPQTYAGAATTVTGLTETSEIFTINLSGTDSSSVDYQYVDNKDYNVFVDIYGNRYIKHFATIESSESGEIYFRNNERAVGGDAYFKIEPIKWDVIGYYTDDSKSTFVKASNYEFDAKQTKNVVLTTRYALQAMLWNKTDSDVDYKDSTICKWLADFYNKRLTAFEKVIQNVTNSYNDSSKHTEINHYSDGGTVDERVWIMDYAQASSVFFYSYDFDNRRVSPSDFAIANYSTCNHNYSTIYRPNGGSCQMWLRSAIMNSEGIVCAGYSDGLGFVNSHGVRYPRSGVRPCMLVSF